MRKIGPFVTLLFLNFIAISQSSDSIIPALELSSNFPNIRDIAISSSGMEGYISLQSALEDESVLVRIKKVKNKWVEDGIAPFSGQYYDLEPFLSKDNLRLYFVSNRPINDSISEPKDFDIWYVERETINAEWGLPINIGTPVNTEYNEFYPSLTQNNNIYFTSDKPTSKGKDDIFYSAFQNNAYSEPISLSDSINTVGYEFNAFVAHDESYLIFTAYNRLDGYGSGDLYISYRDENLAWSKAVNLGEGINSKFMDYCPFIDDDSKTMYFTSKRSSLKKNNNFRSIEEVKIEIKKGENGSSKIYQVRLGKKLPLTKP